MSIFDIFRRHSVSKQEDEPAYSSHVMELDEIWQLTDHTDFLIVMNERLIQRSDYGEHLERLSHEEQVFYICNLLEQEINNGGFDQFLFNSSGNFAHRVEDCLRTIGANKTADICHTAFAAFGKPIPQDWDKRQNFLEKMESDEIADILSDCDDQFYASPDLLEKLNYQYIMANKTKFS